MLQQQADRPHDRAPFYLRIGTTRSCPFSCPYCQPEGPRRHGSSRSLVVSEQTRIVGALAKLGVNRVRLTGGEPLLKPDCAELIQRLKAIPNVREVALTTNGERLRDHVGRLRDAGLDRLNVHLDTLNAERFFQITGRRSHRSVLEGIVAANKAGLTPVKVNVVLMRGVNDDEILDFCNLAASSGVVVRFIELMDTGPARTFVRDRFMSGDDAVRVIQQRYNLVSRFQCCGASPAREFLLEGTEGVIGFIRATSHPFCKGCNRLRLTSEGLLKTCLYSESALDLSQLLRERGASDEELLLEMKRHVGKKRSLHPMLEGGIRSPFSMAHIGG